MLSVATPRPEQRWDALADALARSVAYLISAQAPDGHWEDFALPVGASNAWITAMVGVQLATTNRPDAIAAAERSAIWLERQSPEGRWGYNESVPPDADSTAWAALLCAALGRPAAGVDLDFLRAHQHRCGGVATYLAADDWGLPHACVTGLAALAFEALGARAEAEAARAWLRAVRSPGRGWSGFWWPSAFYPTFVCLHALSAGGLSREERALPGAAEDLATARCVVDLACAACIALLCGEGRGRAAGPIEAVLGFQEPNGRWPASACLRVTRHDPRNATPDGSLGQVYADGNRLFGTSLCCAALTLAARHG